MNQISPLQQARYDYQPKLPSVFMESGPFAAARSGEETHSVADQKQIKELFPDIYGLPTVTFARGSTFDCPPLKVGVILSGGQAPGGHNVIAGLFDGLKALNPDSELFGFLGGPSGLVDNKYIKLNEALVNQYRNTGGFDMICSGRTKLEKDEQFAQVTQNCAEHGIKAIVIIGGDDSNTNACALAQYMLTHKTGVQVIGCPKTIDGDLKNAWIEVSFGFDTATKVYSELIGNIMRDANSSRKYWHFIKLMGRSASHIALECALQTHPNFCLISEEVEEKGMSLNQIVDQITALVVARAENKMKYGVVLIPEGLIEFIPESKVLIAELNNFIGKNKATFEGLTSDGKLEYVVKHLSPASLKAFESMPLMIRKQLLADRDSFGNVQVSRIETEKMLAALVEERLAGINKARAAQGAKPVAFSAQTHFFGYEGRCSAPSNFDADYCYSLGYTAAALIGAGKTGFMASVRYLSCPAQDWEAGGIPLTMMMNMETRHGKDVPVIRKALVDLSGKPFKTFVEHREAWGIGTEYVYPGPIQYFGPSAVCDLTTVTLRLEQA
ncbi:MAG TPA: diphosphate--fructose-6-phosphate 1-phosphotransferase [Lentisphaeria bacterium]|nr:MAG: 6-phosphofructokinase isozyme 1 [Lentisphaerae bacterium ADurb.Bin082]HPY89655.1 diphosphate--fructose-6-phosphate 1-phosphotransferase [Lentisphaeria bacterium]HQL88189.1 diphosphate--fructose-6-phosphate 1-phosphotransferase [Lentisphaeria bacterium]